MLFLAARDPVRHVAIVDALAIGLCVLAVTPIISLYTTDVRSFYPGYLIWARSVGRLVLAWSGGCGRGRRTGNRRAISEEK